MVCLTSGVLTLVRWKTAFGEAGFEIRRARKKLGGNFWNDIGIWQVNMNKNAMFFLKAKKLFFINSFYICHQ